MTTSPLHVLIVDDDRDAADSLAALVALWGHVAQAVYSSAEALDRAKTFEPDLVFTDLFVRGLNGCDLARELKRRFPDVVLVLITAVPLPVARTRCDGESLDFYLPKLTDLDFLSDLLAGIAQRRTAIQTAEVVAVRSLDGRAADVFVPEANRARPAEAGSAALLPAATGTSRA